MKKGYTYYYIILCCIMTIKIKISDDEEKYPDIIDLDKEEDIGYCESPGFGVQVHTEEVWNFVRNYY